MLTRIALASLLVLASGQRPEKPQPVAARSEQQTTNYQRGTDSLPLTAKLLPSTHAKAEAKANQQERENKEASDWWLVKLTGVLAFIGALQLVVFGFQAVQLRRTVTEMKEASILARRKLVAEHPPILGILSVTIRKESDGAPIITFYVENRGDSAGTIIGSWIKDSVVGGPDPRAKGGGAIEDDSSLIDREIKKGELIEVEHRCINITGADLNAELPGITAVGSPVVHRAFPPRTLHFEGILGIRDELGAVAPEWCKFNKVCTPPSRSFSDATVE